MRAVRASGICALAAALVAAPAFGQEPPWVSLKADEKPSAWEFSASVYAYFVPDDIDYASSTLTADHERFHLEARYNYEAQDTASLWIGRNLEFGEKVKCEVTPMIGGVFGHTHGVAPGYHLTLGYKRWELYSEGEYLFDTDQHSDSFFYSWSELTYGPLEWLRAGLVSQRTRAYQTPLNIQRGLLIRASIKSWTLGVYIFNFGWTEPTVVASVTLEF
jgi:hypothetical protein